MKTYIAIMIPLVTARTFTTGLLAPLARGHQLWGKPDVEVFRIEDLEQILISGDEVGHVFAG